MGIIAAEPHDTVEYSAIAALLLAMAEEQGLHPRVVVTVTGGFEVPDSIFRQLQPDAPVLADHNVGKTPPASWSEPLPAVDVTLGDDGKFYTASVDEDDDVAARMAFEPPFADELTDDDLQVVLDNRTQPDGQIPVGREVIRAWAKANGIEVADAGKLKLSVTQAYYQANPAE